MSEFVEKLAADIRDAARGGARSWYWEDKASRDAGLLAEIAARSVLSKATVVRGVRRVDGTFVFNGVCKFPVTRIVALVFPDPVQEPSVEEAAKAMVAVLKRTDGGASAMLHRIDDAGAALEAALKRAEEENR